MCVLVALIIAKELLGFSQSVPPPPPPPQKILIRCKLYISGEPGPVVGVQ